VTRAIAPPVPEARERILEAACELIAEDGIDDVRIARVAMRAGASTALVHHYFSTREDLLAEALTHSFELVGDERFRDETAEWGSATERLGNAIAECLPATDSDNREWVLWVELWLRAVRHPELQPVATRLYARYGDWIAAAIRAGVESGEFAAVDPRALADRTMALLDGFGLRALIRDPAMDTESARRAIAEDLGRELGVDPDALARPG
jgi:AcrR family transcriptional regulator